MSLLTTDREKPFTENIVTERFEKARAAAIENAMTHGDKNPAERRRVFQLRDIRAKAASAIEHSKDASAFWTIPNSNDKNRIVAKDDW